MKKLLILLMILTLFLSGCSLINPSKLLLPDDLEFIKVIEELDTPEKIGNYMEENFTYEYHPIYNPDPYTLWKTKKGDCNDMSTFGVFIANYHDYKTYQIHIFNEGTIIYHSIAVYVEDNYYSITENQYYYSTYPLIIDNKLCFSNFNSFEQIIKYDSILRNVKWTKYIIYDYDMNIILSSTNI